MGLVLASMIVSCSDEDNTIVPETNPDPVIPTEGTFILPAPAVAVSYTHLTLPTIA